MSEDVRIECPRCHGVINTGRPPIVSSPELDLQAGEIVYHIEKGAECIIPHAKGDKHAGTGLFFVTNKRIVFSGERHRQQYRVSNLRDFVPCWKVVSSGVIQIATSDKRREKYDLPNPWHSSLIIMCLFSTEFRNQLANLNEQSAYGFVREKISERYDPLDSEDYYM